MDDSVEDISPVDDDAETMNATAAPERQLKALVVQRASSAFVSCHRETITKGEQ